METVITNKATDSSQTDVSGEGRRDLWRYGVFLPPSLLVPVLFQYQSAHRSSIIHSVSLHCFSFCFHIHHLASVHLVELYLFLECSFFSRSWQGGLTITAWPFDDLQMTELCPEEEHAAMSIWYACYPFIWILNFNVLVSRPIYYFIWLY